MNFGKSAISAAALCVVFAGTAAYAQDSDEPASVIGCMHMQKKVSAALDANQQSPNYGAARAQAQGASGFCTQGRYKTGVNSYAKALDLLGAS
ncbi:MAG: hypothetical protein WDN03_03055 [Rhizomicrobium sp.]